MWRDRVLEEMKRLGISRCEMEKRSNGRLTKKKIDRLLSGEAKLPYVDDVIDLGATVGLSPVEVFSESGLFVGDKDNAALQLELDLVKKDRDSISEDLTKLKDQYATTLAEKTLAEQRVEYMIELIKHKDKIIALLESQKTI